jgi:hypothetical protein
MVNWIRPCRSIYGPYRLSLQVWWSRQRFREETCSPGWSPFFCSGISHVWSCVEYEVRLLNLISQRWRSKISANSLQYHVGRARFSGCWIGCDLESSGDRACRLGASLGTVRDACGWAVIRHLISASYRQRGISRSIWCSLGTSICSWSDPLVQTVSLNILRSMTRSPNRWWFRFQKLSLAILYESASHWGCIRDRCLVYEPQSPEWHVLREARSNGLVH